MVDYYYPTKKYVVQDSDAIDFSFVILCRNRILKNAGLYKKTDFFKQPSLLLQLIKNNLINLHINIEIL